MHSAQRRARLGGTGWALRLAGGMCLAIGGALALSQAAAASPPWFTRTQHSEAQWFPRAGMGLFMHWGIHSVAGIQPSWAMIKDYPHGYDPRYHPLERYYTLADQFNPGQYDPDKWMAAAKRAGFTYAVLTAKHHDGYCLWPTQFGVRGTLQYMGGRDLLGPYVEACRKHGLKVGLYFSPRDWSYPGYPVGDVQFDYNKRGKHPAVDPVANQRAFDEFYEFTIGQLGELLTRYGRIDLLWFDGMGWHGVDDIRTRQTIEWIRKLQPWIVINNRWGGVGDYGTPEWRGPQKRPEGWWEHCISWNGHWGYNPRGAFRSTAWVLSTLCQNRAWGGNFLLNCGPAPDGTMPAGFYGCCDELAQWMSHSRESVIGAGPGPWPEGANVPITTRDDVWYLHFVDQQVNQARVTGVPKPVSAKLLRTAQALSFEHAEGTLIIGIPPGLRTDRDDVVSVCFDRVPVEAAP